MRGKRTIAVAAVAVVLLGLAWYLRNTSQAGKSLVHPGKSPDLVQTPPSPPARDKRRRDEPPSPSPLESDLERADAVERLVTSIDWIAFDGAVLAFTKEQERARREGKKTNYDPGTIEVLSKNNLILQKIAELLGVEDVREVPLHERVWPHYQRGWMSAVGVTLSPAQDADLVEAARAFSRSRIEERKTIEDANPLEKLAWEAERGLRWDEDVRKLLTPEQFAEYVKPGGSDPFWGRQASRQDVRFGSIQDSAKRVESLWQAALGLNEQLRPLVAAAAADYVQQVDRQGTGFRSRYPGDAPREEEMRLRIDLLRLQVNAEKGLGEKLGFTQERREGLKHGSGTIVDWRWK